MFTTLWYNNNYITSKSQTHKTDGNVLSLNRTQIIEITSTKHHNYRISDTERNFEFEYSKVCFVKDFNLPQQIRSSPSNISSISRSYDVLFCIQSREEWPDDDNDYDDMTVVTMTMMTVMMTVMMMTMMIMMIMMVYIDHH